MSDDERGQSTVELALGLPIVVLMLLLLVQVALLARDQVLVTHAAREGARAASVDDDSSAAVRAATASSRALDPARMRVDVDGREGPGSRVMVKVTYRSPVNLPLVGRIVVDDLHAEATMRVER